MKPQAIKQHYITEFVNSGMSQQEAEEKWNEISDIVNENGFIRHFASNYDYIEEIKPYFSFVSRERFEFVDSDHFSKNSNIYFRPKSLKGLENNRGWTSILSEKDLPSDKTTQYSVSKDKKVFQCTVNYGTVKHWYNIGKITHYQPIKKPLPPIF